MFAASVFFSVTPLPPEVPPADPDGIVYQFETPHGCSDPPCLLNRLWPEEINVSALPDLVLAAFVSAEDRGFWEHTGVDYPALARGALACVRNGDCQGGSTIPMQLAKLRYTGRQGVDGPGDLIAKIHEIFIAQFQLGRHFSREEILGRYLASVHFANGLTGLRAAAMFYFNKRPEDLSLQEAAYLAGMLPAPAHREITDPQNRERGWQAAQRVLHRLHEDGRITDAQLDRALRNPPRYRRGRPVAQRRPYLLHYLQQQARRAGYPSGATVATPTIDWAMQSAAEHAVDLHTREARRLRVNCAALVAIRPDGAVLAMVGGLDFTESQQNCAESRHQIGSEFKLITLAAGVAAGLRGDDYVHDFPGCYATAQEPWCPENFDDAYYGWLTIREAIALSANNAGVQLGYRVGLGRVIDMARQAGLPGDYSASRPSFLLGAMEASPFEMARALARITGCGGAEIHVFPAAPGECAPLLRPRALEAFREITAEPLRAPYGTGRAARFRGDESCIVKTGTSNNQRDAWFVGRCGEIIAVVWMGRRDNRPIRMTGGQTPARTWRAFMERAVQIDAQRR